MPKNKSQREEKLKKERKVYWALTRKPVLTRVQEKKKFKNRKKGILDFK